MSERAWRRLTWALLLVAPVLAYWPSIHSAFTRYDDPLYVWKNLERIGAVGWQGLALQWSPARAYDGEFVEYFPLRDSVYWLLYARFRLDPMPYHLASLFFHLCASALLRKFLEQIGLGAKAAFLGALLFALHPVHIESVVWIAGLKDPMFVTFMLGALVAYQAYRVERRPWQYLLMMLSLVAGFWVKALIISAVPIMALMELTLPPRPRVPWHIFIARLVGPGLVTVIFSVQIALIGRANSVFTPPHHGSWPAHWALVVWTQARYLQQALMPVSYRLIYCFEPSQGFADWRFWVGLAVLGAVGALAWHWRREPTRLFLIGFYFLAMAPVSNLAPFPAIMADRYVYAGSAAVCALVALLIAKALRPQLFYTVTAIALVGLTAATAARTWVWNQEELLWEEPDLDPACVTDSAFPAAQVHVLRYYTATNRHEGLMALERAMLSPGLAKVDHELGCNALISAAAEAKDLGEPGVAEMYARHATKLCAERSDTWNIAMVIMLDKNPAGAAKAAQRSWRLVHSPDSETFMWLTRLTIEPEKAVERLNALAELKTPLICTAIISWGIDHPESAPALAQAAETCIDVPARDEGSFEAKHNFLIFK